MEEKKSEIAVRLRARRLELGYSYQTLSDLTGIGRSTLQRYESGHIKSVPLQSLEPLAAALGVSPDWLLGLPRGDEDPDALPRLMARRYGQPGRDMLDALDALSPDGVREAARRVCELSCLPHYQRGREEEEPWRPYVGLPIAARGGGVSAQNEEQARRAWLLEKYLREKGELK